MLRTVEATIDEDGVVTVAEPIAVSGRVRALLTILDVPTISEVTLASEAALSDWNRPEEDEAWASLQ